MRSCVECQFRHIADVDKDGDRVGEDCFYIRCDHPNQENIVGFTAKMKNQYGKIYFNCPDLGWEDKALNFLKELQGHRDFEYDQELQDLLDEKNF